MFLPRPIHETTGYENTVEIADVFVGFEDRMTEDQNHYFDLLCNLAERREQATTRPRKLSALIS
jgi:hypothetical protein